MQRLVETVTDQFRRRCSSRATRGPTTELRTLVGIYFDVIADLQPVNRARLVLWADAVATPTTTPEPAMVAADREFREEIEKRIEPASPPASPEHGRSARAGHRHHRHAPRCGAAIADRRPCRPRRRRTEIEELLILRLALQSKRSRQ